MNSKIKAIAENLLGRHLTTKDGIDISDIEKIESLLGLKLPTALRDFHLLVGNVAMFVSSFQQFVEPYVENGMLVFLEENQCVCIWGINIQEPENETVYMCTDFQSDNPEWYSEKVTLTDFLSIIMYYQCALAGYEFGSAVYESSFNSKEKYVQTLNEITTGFEKVVEHNGLVIYQNDRKLIWHFTDEQGNLADTIFASTRTAEDLKEFERYGFGEL